MAVQFLTGRAVTKGLSMASKYFKKKKTKNWMGKVTKSIKKRGTKGVCTGSKFGGPTCPPGSKRYGLAKVFRAQAAKKSNGKRRA